MIIDELKKKIKLIKSEKMDLSDKVAELEEKIKSTKSEQLSENQLKSLNGQQFAFWTVGVPNFFLL